jgi:hypothetical protein
MAFKSCSDREVYLTPDSGTLHSRSFHFRSYACSSISNKTHCFGICNMQYAICNIPLCSDENASTQSLRISYYARHNCVCVTANIYLKTETYPTMETLCFFLEHKGMKKIHDPSNLVDTEHISSL